MTHTRPVGCAAIDAERVARRFPLVPRPQPACPPLETRLAEIADLAHPRHHDPSRLAAAHNKAALIASDCGHPDLARTLCWLHHHRYPRTRAWTAQETRWALEPLVNLARLESRPGDADATTTLLHALYDAVRHGGQAELDGRRTDFGHLAVGSDDHRASCRWLWTVVLTEGTRALARAGRWDDAHAHARRHNGVGRRLLDGRQVAIVSHALRGRDQEADSLLDATDLRESWEHAVAACLRVIVGRQSLRPARSAVREMLNRYLTMLPAQHETVFTIRLGLTVVDLAGGAEHPQATPAVQRVIRHAAVLPDGYVARELLAHPIRALLPPAATQLIEQTYEAAALGHRHPREDLSDRLLAALRA